ncbi:hypothetical protein [Mycobacterium sp. CnD-18-1]|uniref:hypothetical protein n=1 Tax=Mycobacterium sp. CnD-18-1 TaxID=2917744 RepID=UPI001EF1F95D|nr:hypothetical protein [Mycobacterium sp. CnD-18-1]MCG7607125.1 hypothetical protein [Mycobacterium sp. CnD-18-1]
MSKELPVRYGKDDKLEADANKWLSDATGENKRGIERDIEKMSYESGLIGEDELELYDPGGDWRTKESAFTLYVAPADLEGFEPTICADVPDGNVRAANPRIASRRALMRHVEDADSWGGVGENVPLLGANDGPRKVCTRCKQPKGLQYFSADPRNKADGLYSWCKACHREYVRSTYEKKKKRSKKNRDNPSKGR